MLHSHNTEFIQDIFLEGAAYLSNPKAPGKLFNHVSRSLGKKTTRIRKWNVTVVREGGENGYVFSLLDSS